jgi:hypothetical protein
MTRVTSHARRGALALTTSLGLVACAPAAPPFPTPMTATDLAWYGTGRALAVYLDQPGENPSVCDAKGTGAHVVLDARGAGVLVDAFEEGHVPPEAFRRCAEHLLRSPVGPQLLNRMGAAYRRLVKGAAIETDPGVERRLEALHALYDQRPQGVSPDPERLRDWNQELSKAVTARRLGMVAGRHAAELLDTFSLERGRWSGAPVTENTLDLIQNRHDEALLQRFADRLPDAELRRKAVQRIVRLHIAASAYPEVRGHAREVESLMLKQGRNPISLDGAPPSGGNLETARLLQDRLLVRQEVPAGSAKILGSRGSVAPAISLRGALWIRVPGISRPVTLCGPTREMDPTPCLDPASLRADNGLVSVDADGGLVFVDHARLADLLPLARAADLAVPLSAGGRTLATLHLGVWFEKPGDMPFAGGQPLVVDVDARGERRLVYQISGHGFSYTVVVERSDVPAFRIESRGVPGVPGADGLRGLDGAPGQQGIAAACPSQLGGTGQRGFDGGIGLPGGPGSPGGRGGDITLRVSCGGRDCAPLVADLQRAIVSVGGPGGPGGHGGPGGRGGAGGPGGAAAGCTAQNPDGTWAAVAVAAGPKGADGNDGLRGPEGPPGPPGAPGQVMVQVSP